MKRNLLAGLVLMLSVGTILNTCKGCAKWSCDCFGRHPAPHLHFVLEQQAIEVTVYTNFWIFPAGLRAKETFSALYYTSSDVLKCSADGNTGLVKLVFWLKPSSNGIAARKENSGTIRNWELHVDSMQCSDRLSRQSINLFGARGRYSWRTDKKGACLVRR